MLIFALIMEYICNYYITANHGSFIIVLCSIYERQFYFSIKSKFQILSFWMLFIMIIYSTLFNKTPIFRKMQAYYLFRYVLL